MRLVTSQGHEAKLLAPEEIDYNISDIAWALSQINPYGGHSRPYSIAQHSLAVSYEVDKSYAFAGLMHDAHKAFSGGLSDQQVKAIDHLTNGGWHDYEQEFVKVLRHKFSLPYRLVQDVVRANQIVSELEMGLVFNKYARSTWSKVGFKTRANHSNALTYNTVKEVWSPAKTYERFIERFYEVGNG